MSFSAINQFNERMIETYGTGICEIKLPSVVFYRLTQDLSKPFNESPFHEHQTIMFKDIIISKSNKDIIAEKQAQIDKLNIEISKLKGDL